MRQINQYLAALLIIAAGTFATLPALAQTPQAPPATPAPPAGVAPVLEDIPLGKADAPVTIIEYASLTCPHCAHFANDIFDKVKAAYIDTGKVKWIYRDFPLDEVALRAAMMARCGGAEHYYGFIELIFRQQQHWIQEKDPLQALADLGRLGGITPEQFKACMSNQVVENAVLQSRVNAQKQFDVDSTPTFIINGEKHAGALEFPDFSKVVDALLPAAQAAPGAPAAPSAPSTPAASTPAAPATPATSAPAATPATPAPAAAESGGFPTLWVALGVIAVIVIGGGIFLFGPAKK